MTRNSRLLTIVVFSLSATLSLYARAYSQSVQAPPESKYFRTIIAIRVDKGPDVDGDLNDPVWQTITFDGNFLQREPNEGAPASEKTEIALIYDDKNLYIGARLYDSEPDKIVATQMRHDGSITFDDYLYIFFDTFHDRRSAFYFALNPNASRFDGKLDNDGKINIRNWDGVWLCKTSIDEKGWYAEIAVPWQTLRFPEGEDLVWGVNFIRKIARKNEDVYWRLVPRNEGSGLHNPSQSGDIKGLSNLKMGGNLEFLPFATGGFQKDIQTESKAKSLGDIGLDVILNLTPNLTANFTYNTDFAQIEADQERVNLTRFELFFPEKRDFFLEGAETFSFGNARALNIFHSRRIGISGSRLVPIIGGARLNGKIGNGTTIGALSIQTDRVTTGSSSTIIPETNYSIFRLRQDIFTRSSVGMMFLNKQEIDGSYNRSFGVDSNFPVNNNLTFYVVGAGTFSPNTPGLPDMGRNNFAGNAGFNWRSDLWQYSSSFLTIEKQFNPEIGFVRRRDIRLTNASVTYSPRPKQWSSIRKLNFNTRASYQTDGRNRDLNKSLSGTFSINFENTATMNFTVSRGFEFLERDFEIRPGFLITSKGYTSTRFTARYNYARNKAYGGSINLSGGDFFNGSSFGSGLSANIKARNKFIASASYGYNLVDLPDGQFHTYTLSSRIIYTFTPDFFIKGYFQWIDDPLLLNNRSRLSSNIIMRYTYSPGSDFYIVLNQEDLVGSEANLKINRTILAKFTYFFRK